LFSFLLTEKRYAGGYLYKINPFCKLVFSLVILAYCLAIRSFLPLVTMLAFLLIMLLASKLVMAMLRIMLPATMIGASVFLISYLFKSSLEDAAIFAIRIFILFFSFLIFGATTEPSTFIRSLHSLKLPNQLILAMLIVFRFIPVLVEEMKMILLSFSLRKATARMSMGLFYRGIMVPFVFRLFTLADDLALALHVRGYGNRPRPTVFKPVAFSAKDGFFMAGSFIMVAGLHLFFRFIK